MTATYQRLSTGALVIGTGGSGLRAALMRDVSSEGKLLE